MTLAPGTRLGPYEIVGLLGTGGMGEVYRARDPRLGRDVAIKILTAELSASQTAKELFLREGQAASAMNHPNICTLYDIGEHNGRTSLFWNCLSAKHYVMPLREGHCRSKRYSRWARVLRSFPSAYGQKTRTD